MLPGRASAADTASEHANAFLIGCLRSRIKAGASRNPPALARSPETNPTPAATAASWKREYAGGSSADGRGGDPPDFFSVGEIRKERPSPNTRIAVRINKIREPVNFVRKEPKIVAGTPIAMLHPTICQSIRRNFQYCAEASSVPGI